MYALQTNASTALQSPAENRKQWLKVILTTLFFAALAVLIMVEPAFAQTAPPAGGGSGTAASASARITSVTTGFQGVLYSIGGVLLTAAFMYTGYAMAFGGKQWKDIANVVYGAVIAGLAPVIVGWLFF